MTEHVAPGAETVDSGPAVARPDAPSSSAASLARQARAWLWQRRTEAILLGATGTYLTLVLALMAGRSGILPALALTAAVALLGPRIKAGTILALYRAEPIAPGQGAALRAAIETLSRRAGLPSEPALAIVPSLAIGAFSAGAPPRMALLMTEGLLRSHSLSEIVALAAHEVAHMSRGDLPVFALADTITRLAQGLFYMGIALGATEVLVRLAGERWLSVGPLALLLCAPLLSSMLQLSMPRHCEYEADAAAARLLGNAGMMAEVARKQSSNTGSVMDDFRLPVPQRRVPVPSPLRSHPAGEERRARLALLDSAVLGPALPVPDEPLISLVGFGPIEMKPRNRWPGLWF